MLVIFNVKGFMLKFLCMWLRLICLVCFNVGFLFCMLLIILSWVFCLLVIVVFLIGYVSGIE